MKRSILLILTCFLLAGSCYSQPYQEYYKRAKKELDSENWTKSIQYYEMAIDEGMNQTLNIGKKNLPFLLIRCLLGSSVANQELKNYKTVAQNLTIVISLYR